MNEWTLNSAAYTINQLRPSISYLIYACVVCPAFLVYASMNGEPTKCGSLRGFCEYWKFENRMKIQRNGTKTKQMHKELLVGLLKEIAKRDCP